MYSAIFSRTYAAKDIAEVFADAAQDGFQGVQANLSSAGLMSLPETLPSQVGKAFAEQARAKGLCIAALSGTYNMVHPNLRVREASRVGFCNVVQAARQMGTSVVSLCTGSRNEQDMWRSHPDNASAAAWNDLRSELEFALRLAEENGISLAIEPEPANVIHDAASARRILDEMASASLGIILDAANLLSPATLAVQRQIIAEAAGLLGDSLLLAHAKDIDAEGNVVTPGEGAVDLAAFTKALRLVGYDGALITHGFAEGKTRVAAETLRRLVEESL
jgi:sugar phosphate isomerase/epimerase